MGSLRRSPQCPARRQLHNCQQVSDVDITIARMNELSERAQEAKLTGEEQAERE